jgi:site-specific DNA recombinase
MLFHRSAIVAIKPKPPFIPIFQVAVSKKESSIRIINEPLETSSRVPSVLLVETGEG